MDTKAKPVFYRPRPDVREKLVELSGLTGIPINTIVGRAVASHLDEIEKWYKLQPKSASAVR